MKNSSISNYCCNHCFAAFNTTISNVNTCSFYDLKFSFYYNFIIIYNSHSRVFKKKNKKTTDDGDVIIQVQWEKLNCVGHIQKRVDNRSCNLSKTMKIQLEDGKRVKVCLTDKSIKKLQNYYGLGLWQSTAATVYQPKKIYWSCFISLFWSI